MKSKRLFSLGLTVIFVLMALTSTLFAQGDASVRFVHAVPGADTVDVIVNGQLAVADLSFGDASSYLNVPSGDISISANAAGTGNVVFSQTSSVEAGSAITMIASSASAPQFEAVVDDRGPLAFGNTRFSIVHGIEGGPAIDVVFTTDGTVIAQDVGYGASFGTFDVPADVYDLAVVPTGSDVSASIADLSLPLAGGTTNVVLVYGTPGATQALVASAPTAASNDSGLVRFVHAVNGAAPVDISINGTLVIPALSIEMPSEHIALPSGSHEVILSVDDAEIATVSLDVEAGTAQTVIALGTSSDLSISSFSDDLAGINADSALVSVINTIPDSTIANLTLANGTSIAADLAFDSGSSSSNIDAGNQALTMELAIGGDAGTIAIPASMFYGGSYYNLIVLPGNAFTGPQVLVAETSIMRGLGAAVDVAVVEQPADTGTSNNVIAPTPAPIVTSTEADVTARINLEPGANLQLRQYPSSDALSLGLAPSGTVLAVNGRRGPSEYFEGEVPDEPVDLSEYETDPAEDLVDEDEDLVAEETWLFITYTTPDGGAINAWVNALYLQVFDNEGAEQRLANLDLVRQNEAGEAIATAITPPPIPVDRVSAIVFNLDPGVLLNIRRTKGTDGEVLARVETGTALSFLGIDEDQEWVFIEYLSPDGGAVTGWVSFQYVQLQFNGETVDLEEIAEDDADLVVIVDDEERGDIRGSAERPDLPTPDPLEDVVVGEVFLDVGASLQLRRTPSVDGESLDLIPSGTRLIIEGITNNGEWFNVSFEEVSGWVSSQYLVLSFNGEFVEIGEVGSDLQSFNNDGEIPGSDTDDTETEGNSEQVEAEESESDSG